MTAYTSTQTGNWNDVATWGGGGSPSSGADTATISTDHTVTIPAGVTITCGAITFGAGSATRTTLTINGTLEMAGAITMAAASAMTAGAGAALDLNGYDITGPAPGEYTFIGTANSRITILSTGTAGRFLSGGNGLVPDFRYCDFSGLGNSVLGRTHGGAVRFANYQYCTFTNCGSLALEETSVQDNAGFLLSHCDFRNQSTADPETSNAWYPLLSQSNALGTRARTIEYCTWNKTSGVNSVMWIDATAVNVNSCVIEGCKIYANATAPSPAFSDCFIGNELDQELFKTGNTYFDSFTNCFLHYDQAGHPISIAGAGPYTITGSIFDGSEGDVGTNWFLGGAFNGTVTFSQNICLGQGVMWTFTANSAPTLTFSRNTLYMDNGGTTTGTPAQYFSPLLLTEQASTLTGTVNIYDNLMVDPDSSTARDALVDLLTDTANQLDICDYNAGWGYPLGGSSPAVLYRANGADLAGFGTHDFSADPQFVAKTRRLATWDAANGGPGTEANAIAELLKLNGTGGTHDADYTVALLVTWVKAGFVPQNAALQGTGRTGDDIGAQDVVPIVSSGSTFPGLAWRALRKWRFIAQAGVDGNWPMVR